MHIFTFYLKHEETMPKKPSTKGLLFGFIFLLLTLNAYALTYLSGDDSKPFVPNVGIYAPNEANVYIPLSGDWVLTRGKTVKNVTIPGCWRAGEGSAVLKKEFFVPDSLEGFHYRLIFWKARQKLTVTVNDHLVEVWKGDWNNLVVNIPRDVIIPGENNILQVEVDDALSSKASIPLKPRLFDELPYVGLFADVAFLAGTTTVLEHVKWDAVLSDRYDRAEWKLQLVFRYMGDASYDSSTTYKLNAKAEWISPNGIEDWSGQTTQFSLGPVEASTLELSGRIIAPQLWSPDTPNLYDFVVIISSEDESRSWKYPFKLGISEFDWNSDGILLNKEQHEIKGVLLLQENYDSGAALSVADIEEDLLQIKRLGFNLVRLSDQPHPAIAGLCDRIGLFLIPHTGLKSVPTDLFSETPLQTRLKNTLGNLISRDGNRVCIAGWGIADGLAMDGEVSSILTGLVDYKTAYSSKPLVAGFTASEIGSIPNGVVGLWHRPPYHINQDLLNIPQSDSPWITGGLGSIVSARKINEDETVGQVRQADALLHQLKQIREMNVSGFIVDSYSDRRSAWPLLIAGGSGEIDIIERGLKSINREERIAWRKLADALSQVRIDVPAIRTEHRQFPIIFPLTSIAIIAILLIIRRQNNVFKQNLNRVFAHTPGFFIDIRDRRYFQVSQTALIAIIVSIGQGILLAGWFHYARDNYLFDYLLTLLFPFWHVKRILVEWAWNPVWAIAGFSALHIILILFISFLMRLVSIPFRGRLNYRQVFNMITWGASHFILLLPLGLIHYRLLEFPWYQIIATVLISLFTIWYLIRIASMLNIGCRISGLTSWLMIFVVTLIFIVTTVSIYESGFALLENFEHFRSVILPWIMV